MKRLFGTFFLLLILLNTIGYYALVLLVRDQLTTSVLQRIETNANELGGNLILAIPIQLPYASDSGEYTRVDGEFVYEGQVYQLVKQKFYRDILYIVCIKDDRRDKESALMADYSKLFSGQQAEQTDGTVKILNSVSRDYLPIVHFPKSRVDGWRRISCPNGFNNLYRFDCTDSIFHPPQNS